MKCVMQFGWLRIFLVIPLVAAPVLAADKKPADGVDDHVREELGVNEFTTPGIELILRALTDLQPIPYDDVSRTLPGQPPADRARLALATGGVIADGFLAVIAEKGSSLEPIGRALLAHAKGLGVSDFVTRHTKSILELSARKDWNGVRSELIGTQRDVEKGMMALRDEEIAHLVALGGWWRGLEIAAGIVGKSYAPHRAKLLIQPGVLDYFSDRVSTLNPRIKSKPPFAQIEKGLSEVRELVANENETPPSEAAVKKISGIAKSVNAAIYAPEE